MAGKINFDLNRILDLSNFLFTIIIMKTNKVENKESMWVSKHQKALGIYAGKWIAVIDNKVVAAGRNVKEVMELCKKKKLTKLPLVTKIPRKDEEMYVL